MVDVGIGKAFALAREAYERPDVHFLSDKQHGRFMLTVVTSAFTRYRESMPVEQFHAFVGTVHAQLRDACQESLPSASPRALCAAGAALQSRM